MHFIKPALLVTSAIVLGACGRPDAGVEGKSLALSAFAADGGSGCVRGECPANQYCDLSRSPPACNPGCTASEPCLGGFTCIIYTQNGVGLCVAGCYRDSDCPSGRVCTGDAFHLGQCVADTLGKPCTTSDDCGFATVCDRATGKCVAGCHGGTDPGYYQGEAECDPPNTHCENERCVAGCDVGACPTGQRCDTTRTPPACVSGCTGVEPCAKGEACFRPNPDSLVGFCLKGCVSDGDCPNHHRCVLDPDEGLGSCQCQDDEGCALGQLCRSSGDGSRSCVPGCRRCADCDRDGLCDGLSPKPKPRGCPDGKICNGTGSDVDGQCVTEQCLFPSDCPAGTYCQPTLKRCVKPQDVDQLTDGGCPYGTYEDPYSIACLPGCNADWECADYSRQFREVECVQGSYCNRYTHTCQDVPFVLSSSETDEGFDPLTSGWVRTYDDPSCESFVTETVDECSTDTFVLSSQDPAFPRELMEVVGRGNSLACDNTGKGPRTERVFCSSLCQETMPDDAISTEERYDGGRCVTDPEPRNAARCACHRWESARDTEAAFNADVAGCVIVYTGAACSGDSFERFCDRCDGSTLLELGTRGCIERDGADWPEAFEQRVVNCDLACFYPKTGRCETVTLDGFSAGRCVCD